MMGTMNWTIRPATEADAAGCAAIYAPYVVETAITFEIDPPGPTEMSRRIAEASTTHAWLVLEDAGTVVGYAYGRRSISGRRTAGRARPASTWRWGDAEPGAAVRCTTRCSRGWRSAATGGPWAG